MRINTGPKDISIFRKINEMHIKNQKSNKKLSKESTKISLIEKTSKRLLELEFRENNSIKTKCVKCIVEKIAPKI